MLLVAAVFCARPLEHAVRAWQSRRAAAQALALIDRGQWAQARSRATDAYQLQPVEPMAVRAVGRLLARTRNANAMLYYQQLRFLHYLTPEDRRDYASIALSVGATTDAAEQSAWLLAHPSATSGSKRPPQVLPGDLLLAAQVASVSGDEPAALSFARRLLDDPAASETDQFTAAVRLVDAAANSGDPNGAGVAPVWNRVRRLAGSRGPVGLQALTLLSRRPAPLAGESTPTGWMSPAEVACALDAHPLASVQDHLLALNLAAGTDPGTRAKALDTAVARWRNADDTGLAALAGWLLGKGEAVRALDVLPPVRTSKNTILCLRRMDALASLGRWEDIRALLTSEKNPLDAISQHMYLAGALVHSDDQPGAATEWNVALQTAGQDPNRLYALAQYAESQGARDVAEDAYAAAIAVAPRMRPAHEALCRLTASRGETAKTQAALTAMLEFWPRDPGLHEADDYLRLLLGATGADAQAIEKTAGARELLEPGDWQVRATLSLARLHLGETTGALQAFAGLHAAGGGSVPPGALAVRAAALANAGWRDEAEADARSLTGAPLLPEERALIAPWVEGSTPH